MPSIRVSLEEAILRSVFTVICTMAVIRELTKGNWASGEIRAPAGVRVRDSREVRVTAR